MLSKKDFITELYKRTIKDVTSDSVAWRAFLHSASYQYKYPFEDQVLIYAQRPFATACADFDTWHKEPLSRRTGTYPFPRRARRYARRGGF